ncbi:multi-sensor hybrid histidine kinase : Multi-sensor hybrid histidine kinase OS=Spirochaeta smaragdinae (strain DSM 11293 / JCM 15392 / SEBR 4228) GN=Spirs_1827 PE=4 SV=1: Response_reg: PAS_4: HisKA: HATPase_c: Response_reg [Gemmata massiliana]|uniref:histidine kinase n=1 Tax=Gemmata massiliana TaxID=1210884 RepID=A0A6P2CVJ5_9BACT|nr:hybrid sensor histidine kinase/response regulator [Gemmata massiliana]VTR92979.1 multi-sensor hybrid histidine kinase : Multi-sensor hybrid histidine kinase OS=Spirochaeta smaragdinae (strain DSM 11293 / JCM 15392 / SEBR 4228) GN=Spirs_1827 PE=4 SV=1: Response_reg: PAS_4: HisKA: HATPase_c: Response_reg [Gemmata massiliana]
MPASVLIVEDERIIALGIQKRLTSMGYSVAGLAANGPDAVRKATDLRPNLVLMDIRLEGEMDGIEAAARVRGQLELPVVYLTANSDPETLRRAKITEPYGYVLKPYEDRDLQTAIEMALYKHEMERRLRENERWLAATLGSIGDGLIAIDEGGRVRFMNGLAEQLTGWTAVDAQGRPVEEVFPIVSDRTRALVTNPALEALRTREPAAIAEGTLLLRRTGGELPIDDSAAPISDANGRIAGAVLVFRDVTERKRLEEHLRQAQKMEAVGRLAGGIAHDFNNIMTVIGGFSELILSGILPPSEVREHLQEVKAASERAAALTRQILAFSRKQILLPCALNLNAVMRDTAGMVRRLIGSHIEFTTEADPLLGPVTADPTQITQVLMNLALNARDAMPRGGRLTVRTSDLRLDEEAAPPIPGLKPGRYAVLEMTDTGSGMTEEVKNKIFEPFFTTKGSHGTGLGLSTVYGIVRQSEGDIEVASAPGRGTTFRVYLPVSEPLPDPRAAEGGRPSDRGTETILVTDDDAGVRRVITMLLAQKGYVVIDASSGPEALELARAHAGPIHMLLTDVVMPGMSGGELAQAVVPVRPGIKVMFVSGYTEDALVERGLAESTAAFLHKPFTAEVLTRLVREVLDRPAV